MTQESYDPFSPINLEKNMKLIAILTPAKTLTTRKIPSNTIAATTPRFEKRSKKLIESLKKLSQARLKGLLKVSDKIAALNYERYQNYEKNKARPCICTFDGAAHRGFDPFTLTRKNQEIAQEKIRIVSGLYGILRLYDKIKPYRLEMGTKKIDLLGETESTSLYHFWGETLTNQVVKDLGEDGVLVDCCSKEYSKAVVKPKLLQESGVRVVTCVFPGPSVYAKRARGMMCRYIVNENISDVEKLKLFQGFEDDAEYKFDARESTKDKFVFHRRTVQGKRKKTRKS